MRICTRIMLVSALFACTKNAFSQNDDIVIIQDKRTTSCASMYTAKEARSKNYRKLVVSRGNVTYRSMLQFDLKSARKENVKDAFILLYSTKQYYDKPMEIGVHAITQAWDQAFVNYYRRNKNNMWRKPGGDFERKPLAVFELPENYINGWIAIKSKELTERVNQWINNPQSNKGLLLNTAFKYSGQAMKFFAGGNNFSEAEQPKLVLSYGKKINPVDFGCVSLRDAYQAPLLERLELLRKHLLAHGEKYSSEINELAENIRNLAVADKAGKKLISGKLDNLRTRYMKSIFRSSGIHTWKLGPWTKISKWQIPSNVNATIQAMMLKGEYQELSAAVTSLSDDKQELSVMLENNSSFPDKNIEIRASYWVKGKLEKKLCKPGQENFVWIDDALPRLKKDKYLTLLPGETRRLWLTVYADENQKAGNYSMTIKIYSSHKKLVGEIPVNIRIVNKKLEKDPELYVYTYAYLNRRSTAQHKEFVLADLRKHYQNTFVLNVLPKYNPTTGKTDFFEILNYLRLIPDAKKVLFFWNCECGDIPFCKSANWLTPEWKSSLKKVISRWYDCMKDAGFGYDRVAMYPFDETYDNKCCGRTEYQALYDVAKELKMINPAINVFADPVAFGKKDLHELQRIAPVIDIWAPVQSLYHRESYKGWPKKYTERDKIQARAFFHEQQKQGKLLWTYQCDGPTRTMEMNTYYRQYPWRAWYYNCKGLGIWSYNDIRGGSSWNDLKAGIDFSMVYELRDAPDDIPKEPFEPLIPSRRWQMWRRGIQDYFLLQQVKNSGAVPLKELKIMVNEVLQGNIDDQQFIKTRLCLISILCDADNIEDSSLKRRKKE